jgi:hypothetical protein
MHHTVPVTRQTHHTAPTPEYVQRYHSSAQDTHYAMLDLRILRIFIGVKSGLVACCSDFFE